MDLVITFALASLTQHIVVSLELLDVYEALGNLMIIPVALNNIKYRSDMRHYIKQNQQFVTQSEMRLVTAKVSKISVQVAGVVDWKNKTEDRFDSIQRSLDTLVE